MLNTMTSLKQKIAYALFSIRAAKSVEKKALRSKMNAGYIGGFVQ